MPDEKKERAPTLTERFLATIITGALTTPTRNALNLVPNYTDITKLIEATANQRLKNMRLNVPRTTTAVFSQMLAIETTKKQFGKEAKLESVIASSTSGACVAKIFESPLIKIAQAKKISPTAHFKGFTIVSDTMPTFNWSIRSPFLFLLYWIREFCFTVTVLTNETHLSLPKKNDEVIQFSYDLTKQVSLYSIGSLLSASVHKIIVPTAARDIFDFAKQGTTPNIEADGIFLTCKKLWNNSYTHPGFKGPHTNPTSVLHNVDNTFKALCGWPMFATRTFYLLTTKIIIDNSLYTVQKISDKLHAKKLPFFSNTIGKPVKEEHPEIEKEKIFSLKPNN